MHIPTFVTLSLLALLGTAAASPTTAGAKEKPLAARVNILPNGATCNKDGSLGVCQSNFCMQNEGAATGVCR
ncbi:hypothetical protein BO86DRAFT_410728 [Aspergillus japonicus CBS 114.51]|uniref:Uncharacterized protein n=1 Tax=Aspergillus japonicus CBS 114.51 TaxID=1448312 RepID=A0A8T8WXH5_ASPJA|nr:hypothetical protein BO86DRAFT_410728 [Aspergillus japonicus CBS 114.51]RAH80587.1 hypothetical protein BO86DRAFT_410728 [Aspergillus japonicus CBS 114.51]